MTLKVAIVGAGLMGRWHARAARRTGASLVAVVDTDAAAAGALASRSGDAKPYPTLGAAVAAGPLDVVHICTPLATHVALAEEAITAGAHVLVEKPFAENAESTRRVLELAASRGRLACPVHQFLFQRGVVEAGARLGRISPLRHLGMTICSAGAAGRTHDEADHIAGEILPHPLSLVAYLVPQGFAEAGWMVLHPVPGEWHASTAIAGVMVTIRVSMHARPTRNELHLLGERGSVYADLFHGFAVVEPGAVSRSRKALRPLGFAARTGFIALGNLARRALRGEPAYPGLETLVGGFYAAILNDAPAPISPEAVLAVAKTRDRILAAGI